MATSVTTVSGPSAAALAAKKAAQARINAALADPSATGMKGFLIWVQAAWPKAISAPIIKAAHDALAKASASGMGAYMRSMGALAPGAPVPVTWGGPNTFGRLGRFGALGQTATSTVAATPSSSATPSWMSDITSAISAVGQAYLTKTQVSDAQTLFNTNLQRAQMGLSPLATNPADYGLPSPTVNFGLASGTSSLIMYGGIAAAAIAVGYLVVHATKK